MIPASLFIQTPNDWFHNNSVAYNRADDSLIVSSRENFLICIDYETGAIKWILGDPTKKWCQFPSLRRYALTLAPGSLPPIGQHAISVTFDQNILVFDNGQNSTFQEPAGTERAYSTPRKYKLDLNAKTATEIWNFELGQSMWCPFCGSVYEDAPLNYLIDFSFVDGVRPRKFRATRRLERATSETVFRYQYHRPRVALWPLTPFLFIWKTRNFRQWDLGAESFDPRNGFNRRQCSDRRLYHHRNRTQVVVLRALGPSLGGFGVSGVLGRSGSEPV